MHRERISLTVNPAMTVALDILAERSGLSRASQAMVLLRQALDRTIQSAEARERMARRMAYRSAAQWREDAAADREVDHAIDRATDGDDDD